MRFDLKQLFDGLVGMLLVAALLLLGMLFGLSIAVLSRGIAGETLLGLWGPAVGATIGASATILAAMYNQRLTERRELRRPIGAMLTKLGDVSYILTLLAYRLNGVESRPKKDRWIHDLIIKSAKDAHAGLMAIEVEHALPPALADTVSDHITRAATDLHMEVQPRVEVAARHPDDDDAKALWVMARETTGMVQSRVDSAIAALKAYRR